MNDLLMQTAIRDYCCSRCYGHLVAHADPERRWRVECPNCGPGQGFVTKYYAERHVSDSVVDKSEVTHLMQDLGITENPHKGKSAEQIIEEFGY